MQEQERQHCREGTSSGALSISNTLWLYFFRSALPCFHVHPQPARASAATAAITTVIAWLPRPGGGGSGSGGDGDNVMASHVAPRQGRYRHYASPRFFLYRESL